MKKRALVIGSGTLRGAYDAGAAVELCRDLGPTYFDAFYGCSGGSYAATFFATNQPDVIENVWRNHIHGNQFVNFLNPLRGRHVLDLEYLAHLFQHGETLLHVEKIDQSSASLVYVLTDRDTGNPVYVHSTQERVFDLLKASASMPILHPPQLINGVVYIDGCLSDPLPFLRAFEDGYEEVVVVYNKPKGFLVGGRYDAFVDFIGSCVASKTTARLIKTFKLKFQKIEQQIEQLKNVKVIRPKIQLPLRSILDTNKARPNACVDMGIADAKEFLKTYHE